MNPLILQHRTIALRMSAIQSIHHHNQDIRRTVKVLSVDAWRDGSGWTWNNWHTIGEVPLYVCAYKPRKLLQYMRDEGFLSKGSQGKGEVIDDGYNVTLCDRGNHRPVIALEYGVHV